MTDVTLFAVPGSTGFFELRGRVWWHDPTDLTDYLAVPVHDAGVQVSRPGEVRTYGTDETAVVRTFGSSATRTYTLRALPPEVVDMFHDRAGRVQWVRDHRGAAYHGVFSEVDVSWWANPRIGDVTVTVTEVTAPHLIGEDTGDTVG